MCYALVCKKVTFNKPVLTGYFPVWGKKKNQPITYLFHTGISFSCQLCKQNYAKAVLSSVSIKSLPSFQFFSTLLNNLFYAFTITAFLDTLTWWEHGWLDPMLIHRSLRLILW